MYLMQKIFDMPTYFVAEYVSDQMRKETSFLNEGTHATPSLPPSSPTTRANVTCMMAPANNARKTIDLLAQTPSLKGKVHVPAVYPELSSDKVLTMEFVDACRIDDKAQLQKWGMSLKSTVSQRYAVSAGFASPDPALISRRPFLPFVSRWTSCSTASHARSSTGDGFTATLTRETSSSAETLPVPRSPKSFSSTTDSTSPFPKSSSASTRPSGGRSSCLTSPRSRRPPERGV